MQLVCGSCGQEVLADDINIQLTIAKCRGCHAVFNFAEQIGAVPVAASRKPLARQPRSVQLENWGNDLTIRWRWYTHAVWMLLAFCVFWDGFLVVWYAIGINQLLSGKGDGGIWLMLVFPVLHLAVGIGLTYLVVATFINHTEIRVSMGELAVRHGPVPWWGNHRLPTIDIEQIYCTETFHKKKNSHHGNWTYKVIAQLRDNTKKSLASLHDEEHALFLEQTLENHLGLADKPVAGEMKH